MRVGLSVTPLFKKNRDGIFTYTQALLDHFAENSCEVEKTSFLRNDNISSGEVDFLGSYELNFMKQLAGFSSQKLVDLEKKIDLYHVTDYRIIRLKNTPVVASLHDAIPFKYPDWANPKLRWVKNCGMKQAVKWVDRVISISHAAIPDLVEYWGVDPANISVVHLGVSDFWSQVVSLDEKQRVLNKHQLPSDFILFVGSTQPRKNLARLLKAFRNLPDSLKKQHRLVLVAQRGWTDEAFLQDLRLEVDKGNAYWLEGISREDLRCLYQSAALFCFPSLYEGFGLPVLEAFASKVPVLTSNVSALPEIAGQAAMLVNPYDADEMTEKMRYLLGAKSFRDKCIEKGIEQAEKLNWNHCVRETLNVYRSVLGSWK